MPISPSSGERVRANSRAKNRARWARRRRSSAACAAREEEPDTGSASSIPKQHPREAHRCGSVGERMVKPPDERRAAAFKAHHVDAPQRPLAVQPLHEQAGDFGAKRGRRRAGAPRLRRRARPDRSQDPGPMPGARQKLRAASPAPARRRGAPRRAPAARAAMAPVLRSRSLCTCAPRAAAPPSAGSPRPVRSAGSPRSLCSTHSPRPAHLGPIETRDAPALALGASRRSAVRSRLGQPRSRRSASSTPLSLLYGLLTRCSLTLCSASRLGFDSWPRRPPPHSHHSSGRGWNTNMSGADRRSTQSDGNAGYCSRRPTGSSGSRYAWLSST